MALREQRTAEIAARLRAVLARLESTDDPVPISALYALLIQVGALEKLIGRDDRG